jgi:hypothetical protein
MIPETSCRTFWSRTDSFFSSSFWKSSARRAASATLALELLLALAPGVRRQQRALLLDLLAELLELDATAVHLLLHRRLSRSSCSRAATPAAERASTRCTSM